MLTVVLDVVKCGTQAEANAEIVEARQGHSEERI